MQSHNIHPQEHLIKFITGKWLSKPIYAVTELGIADFLLSGPMTISDLAHKTATKNDLLYRIMRALASIGIFSEDEYQVFSNTQISELLTKNAMKPMVQLFNSPWNDLAWKYLLDSLKSGEVPFKLAHGMGINEWLHLNPDAADIFNKANALKAASNHGEIVKHYDFSHFDRIIDIGGGLGALMVAILNANPSIKGAIGELSSVLQKAIEFIESENIADRCSFIETDIFDAIPSGYDCLILSNILHDWPDDSCIEILNNCRRAMSTNSKLLIIEMMIDKPNRPSIAKLLDLEMMVICGGKERTEIEFSQISKSSGLRITNIITMPSGTCIIEMMTNI